MCTSNLFLLLVFIFFINVNGNLLIINGENATSSDYPYMVSLRLNGIHFCGGTILNKNYILTAAHCFNDDRAKTDLRIGFFSSDKLVLEINATNITLHSYSRIENINDVAIVKLQDAIPDYLCNPVKLCPKNFSTANDSSGTLIGWGLTQDKVVPELLQKVGVIVYDDKTCESSYHGIYDMDKNLCAGWPENGRGSCQGDSGGPLLVNGKQVGIVSFGFKGDCGVSNRTHPKVLTRVTQYLGWIKENSAIAEKDEDANDDDDKKVPGEDGSGGAGKVNVNSWKFFGLFTISIYVTIF